MTQTFNPERRRFLRNSALIGLGFTVAGIAAPYVARAAATQIRISVNPGLENATLTALLNQQGFLRHFGADAMIVEANGASGPFDAIAAGAADVCMVSGYDGLLSRIEKGAPVKIIGAGMKKTALTVFARPDAIDNLADLQGKTVAVGPSMGLLHTLMLELLKERNIDASRVKFVNKGSNDQCYRAVANGEADACCASISHLNDQDGLVVINEGNLWESLPRYTFQMAYASDVAIKDKHEGLVAVMAAYGALYEYLMSPTAHEAYFEARRRAEKQFNEASAKAIWDFIQVQRPYSRDLSLTEDAIGYRQDLDIAQGDLKRKQPFAQVAAMSAARAAAKLLG